MYLGCLVPVPLFWTGPRRIDLVSPQRVVSRDEACALKRQDATFAVFAVGYPLASVPACATLTVFLFRLARSKSFDGMRYAGVTQCILSMGVVGEKPVVFFRGIGCLETLRCITPSS